MPSGPGGRAGTTVSLTLVLVLSMWTSATLVIISHSSFYSLLLCVTQKMTHNHMITGAGTKFILILQVKKQIVSLLKQDLLGQVLLLKCLYPEPHVSACVCQVNTAVGEALVVDLPPLLSHFWLFLAFFFFQFTATSRKITGNPSNCDLADQLR